MGKITADRVAQSVLPLALLFMLITGMPAAAVQSTSGTSPQEITEDLSCGKCGMFPAKYPQWQSQIIFSDGSMVPFDGCKCMFDYMFNMKKFNPSRTADQIGAVWVRDFTSGQWTAAEKAIYVVNSDTMGPMGKELIPFADQAEAEAFRKDHGGEIASFDQINMETLKPLFGKMHMKKGMNKQHPGVK